MKVQTLITSLDLDDITSEKLNDLMKEVVMALYGVLVDKLDGDGNIIDAENNVATPRVVTGLACLLSAYVLAARKYGIGPEAQRKVIDSYNQKLDMDGKWDVEEQSWDGSVGPAGGGRN